MVVNGVVQIVQLTQPIDLNRMPNLSIVSLLTSFVSLPEVIWMGIDAFKGYYLNSI